MKNILPEEKLIRENFEKGGELRDLVRKDLTFNWLIVLLKSLSNKLKRRDFIEIILKRLKKVPEIRGKSWIEEKERELRQVLENLSEEKLKELFLDLSLNIKIQTIKKLTRMTFGLKNFLKILIEKGKEEIDNLSLKEEFCQMICQGKFKDPKAKFPTIVVPVHIRSRRFPGFAMCLQGKRRIQASLNKNDFSLGTKVIIREKKFEEEYGWIFEIIRKDKPSIVSERIITTRKARFFTFSYFNLSRIRKLELLRWIKGEQVSLLPFRRAYKKRSGFFLFLNRKRGKKKTIKIWLNCKDGDEIEVVPIPTTNRDELKLDFYKITEEGRGRLLKSYLLKRRPFSLISLTKT